jgi:hypothetical protein
VEFQLVVVVVVFQWKNQTQKKMWQKQKPVRVGA